MHSATPAIDSSEPTSTTVLLPVMHTAVRPAPGTGSALYPSDSMRSQTARICSSVAWECMTTSMGGSAGQEESISLLHAGDGLQMRAARRARRRLAGLRRIPGMEETGGAGQNRTADKGFAGSLYPIRCRSG